MGRTVLRILSALVAINSFFFANWNTQAASEDWKVYGKLEPYFVEYYDAGSLSYPAKDVVRLRVKSVCADKEKCGELHKEWIEKRVLSRAYEKWDYRVSFAEIQCKIKKIRYLSTTNVDVTGKVIDSDTSQAPPEWIDIRGPWNQPHPLQDLLELVCK